MNSHSVIYLIVFGFNLAIAIYFILALAGAIFKNFRISMQIMANQINLDRYPKDGPSPEIHTNLRAELNILHHHIRAGINTSVGLTVMLALSLTFILVFISLW